MLKLPRQEFLQNELDISSTTVVDNSRPAVNFMHFMGRKTVPIRGKNEIVEVNEAKIGKRKFNKRRLVTDQ